MNEEETRESLRRFIRDWQELIGSDPAKLSLIERTDQPDGSKLAFVSHRGDHDFLGVYDVAAKKALRADKSSS